MINREETAGLTLPVGERDHVRGPLRARVTVVEYGDFECPYCKKAYYIVKEILRRLGDEICFVFRNFPLGEIHPHARLAAEAAEAAGFQGKFWEMHDILYEHQDALEEDNLRQYAADLGLDMARFDRELDEHTHEARVREDFLSGIRSGVNATPTFFINDIRYDYPLELPMLLGAVEDAM